MPAHASTSAAAALQATEANSSTDVEIPPLAFDTEDELHAVLERWRGDLLRRVEERCGGVGKDKGKGKAETGKMSAQDRQRVEELVMKVSRAGFDDEPPHADGFAGAMAAQ